jgi:hypothetical protein
VSDRQSQLALYYTAERNSALLNEAFLEIMTGPHPMTREELRKLIAKRPSVYGRFSGWLEVLK